MAVAKKKTTAKVKEYDIVRDAIKKTAVKRKPKIVKATLEERVALLEKTMAEAMVVGEKIHSELERWRSANAPKWKSRSLHDGKPDVRHAKVLVMLRNGERSTDAHSVDSLSWGECGDRTIIAYAVI
jgi:hypothetical protein